MTTVLAVVADPAAETGQPDTAAPPQAGTGEGTAGEMITFGPSQRLHARGDGPLRRIASSHFAATPWQISYLAVILESFV
jgi:hypothetical protein